MERCRKVEFYFSSKSIDIFHYSVAKWKSLPFSASEFNAICEFSVSSIYFQRYFSSFGKVQELCNVFAFDGTMEVQSLNRFSHREM